MARINKFRLSVRVHSDNARKTLKRGKSISRATRMRLVAYVFVLNTF